MPRSESVKQYFTHPAVIFVIMVRVLSALYILIDPFWGFMLYLFFDFVDGYLFAKPGLSTKHYMQLDRPLDWLGYLTMLIVVSGTQLFPFFLILLFIRLIGQIFYMKTGDTKYYIVFPNYYEAFYFWFILLAQLGKDYSNIGLVGLLFLIILFVIQFLRELFIHKYQHEYIEEHGQFKIALKLGFPEKRK